MQPLSTEPSQWTMTLAYFDHLDKVMRYITDAAFRHDPRCMYDGLRQLLNLVVIDVNYDEWKSINDELEDEARSLLSPNNIGSGKAVAVRRMKAENDAFIELLKIEAKVYKMMQHLLRLIYKKGDVKADMSKQLGVYYG